MYLALVVPGPIAIAMCVACCWGGFVAGLHEVAETPRSTRHVTHPTFRTFSIHHQLCQNQAPVADNTITRLSSPGEIQTGFNQQSSRTARTDTLYSVDLQEEVGCDASMGRSKRGEVR